MKLYLSVVLICIYLSTVNFASAYLLSMFLKVFNKKVEDKRYVHFAVCKLYTSNEPLIHTAKAVLGGKFIVINKINVDSDCSLEIKRHTCSLEGKL